jgi:mannose-6-phosphate isomerase-like protein (cupin superfamily)
MSESKRASFDDPHGQAVVIPDAVSEGWWQPQPANGHADVILSPRNIRSVHPFSMGTQTVPVGGTVRLHAHDRSEEVLYVLQGHGTAVVDGKEETMAPGTALFLGHNRSHTFHNSGTQEMKWLWFFMPGGLEDFFEQIGRPRIAGEASPQPFARPSDVKAIEAATVFAAKV